MLWCPGRDAGTLANLKVQLRQKVVEVDRLRKNLQDAEQALAYKDEKSAEQVASIRELEACILRLREKIRHLTKASVAAASSGSNFGARPKGGGGRCFGALGAVLQLLPSATDGCLRQMRPGTWRDLDATAPSLERSSEFEKVDGVAHVQLAPQSYVQEAGCG